MKIPPWSEFLNTTEEWHALWEGLLEPWIWWWYKPFPPDYYLRVIDAEHVYYRLGKAIGATLLLSLLGLGLWWILR